MLRSSNCVLTGKTPMEFSKLNECPLDPGKRRMTQNENSPIVELLLMYVWELSFISSQEVISL